MAYNALKSIDLTNFVNVLMCFLVSCSNGRGQVSPVQTMAFCRTLLSFFSCVQFKIVWLSVLLLVHKGTLNNLESMEVRSG